MPKYSFYPSPGAARDDSPAQFVLFNDDVAMRVALSPQFPGGCEVWQGTRFVGRFHRAAVAGKSGGS